MDQQIRYGIPASITLAQMAIESGYGTSDHATKDKNYFGIKTSKNWTGQVSYSFDDHTYKEPFKVYNTPEDSVRDHSNTLMRVSSYRRCWDSDSYVHWAQSLQGTYATDPEYAAKLINRIEMYHLDQYDLEAKSLAASQGVQCGYQRGKLAVLGQGASPQASSQASAGLPAGVSARWCMPLTMEKYEVVAHGVFNDKRSDHLHQGVDITTHGQSLPLYATEDGGKVVRMGYDRGGGGNYVVVQYPSGVETKYMHMSSVSVKKGNTVDAGDQVGVSGNTGRSNGTHLHFEVRYRDESGNYDKDKPADPLEYLAKVKLLSGSATSFVVANQDVTAAYKEKATPAANQVLMAASGGQNAASGQNGQESLLSALRDIDKDGVDIGGTGDIIADLVGEIFKLAITVSAFSTMSKAAEDGQTEEKAASGEEETERQAAIRRERETVNAEDLRAEASSNYDRLESQTQERQQQQRIS